MQFQARLQETIEINGGRLWPFVIRRLHKVLAYSKRAVLFGVTVCHNVWFGACIIRPVVGDVGWWSGEL